MSGQSAHERALAGAARAHHADHFAAADCKRDAVESRLVFAETVAEIAHFQGADDVPLLLNDPLGEVAHQHLARVDADGVAIGERRGIAHRDFADKDRPVGLQHVEMADLVFVVALDLQQHLAAGAG